MSRGSELDSDMGHGLGANFMVPSVAVNFAVIVFFFFLIVFLTIFKNAEDVPRRVEKIFNTYSRGKRLPGARCGTK